MSFAICGTSNNERKSKSVVESEEYLLYVFLGCCEAEFAYLFNISRKEETYIFYQWHSDMMDVSRTLATADCVVVGCHLRRKEDTSESSTNEISSL
jgi:hypothetical protein